MRLVFLFLVLAIAACESDSSENRSSDPTANATQARSFTPGQTVTVDEALQPSSGQRAEVVQVIDGDTIDVVIDGVEERIRYPAVNSPEQGACLEEEATAANEELVAGKTVLLALRLGRR